MHSKKKLEHAEILNKLRLYELEMFEDLEDPTEFEIGDLSVGIRRDKGIEVDEFPHKEALRCKVRLVLF